MPLYFKKMNNAGNEIEAFEWWSKQRSIYNVGLIVAGIVGFFTYLMIFWTSYESMATEALKANEEPPEITIVTTLFQFVAYLFMIGIANICYFLGPISEKLLKPKNVKFYRRMSCFSGYLFSIALPLCIPIILLVGVIRDWGHVCP